MNFAKEPWLGCPRPPEGRLAWEIKLFWGRLSVKLVPESWFKRKVLYFKLASLYCYSSAASF